MTDLTTSPLAAAEPAAKSSGYWKFWGTTLWGLAIVAVLVGVGIVGVFATLLSIDVGADLSDSDLQALLYSDPKILLGIFGPAFVVAFGVIALAIRLSRIPMRDYLGLILPRGRDVMLGIGGILVIYAAFAVTVYLMGPFKSSAFVVELYHRAAAQGMLPALVLAIVVVAPVSEEILFRGFLLPGWAASRLGPIGAIVLTSAAWTAGHTQYNWLILADIFCIGLWLGWLRQKTGSTVLTMVAHAFQNCAALLQVAILDRMG
jgi:membrane protease YdiL (CAAX protease family)